MARASSGTGQGGKSFQDREKAAKVRNEVLDCLSLVMADDPKVNTWSEYKKRMVERMGPVVLPRINEHSGKDGEPIQLQGVEIVFR